MSSTCESFHLFDPYISTFRDGTHLLHQPNQNHPKTQLPLVANPPGATFGARLKGMELQRNGASAQ